jgi:hypothetical protein
MPTYIETTGYPAALNPMTLCTLSALVMLVLPGGLATCRLGARLGRALFTHQRLGAIHRPSHFRNFPQP